MAFGREIVRQDSRWPVLTYTLKVAKSSEGKPYLTSLDVVFSIKMR